MVKDASIYIAHMVENCQDICLFLSEISKNDFLKNKEKQNAVIRSLEIIGEASKVVPVHIKQNYPAIPWKEMSGTRDILIHQYFGVDLNLIWTIAVENIPQLLTSLQRIEQC